MKKKKKLKCCICGCEIEGYGNDPTGAMWYTVEGELEEFVPSNPNDRCCDDCDNKYVIPGRLYKLSRGVNNERSK